MQRPRTKTRRTSPPRTRHEILESIAAEFRARNAREALSVQTMLHEHAIGGSAVVGPLSTLAALQIGVVTEIFITSRFLETQPGAMPSLLSLASRHDVAITRVVGSTALELDLTADGIGAFVEA